MDVAQMERIMIVANDSVYSAQNGSIKFDKLQMNWLCSYMHGIGCSEMINVSVCFFIICIYIILYMWLSFICFSLSLPHAHSFTNSQDERYVFCLFFFFSNCWRKFEFFESLCESATPKKYIYIHKNTQTLQL